MNQRITRLSDTVAQIRIPLPFPLRWVNSYLVRDGHGYSVIDPGLHTAESEQVWRETLAELDIGFDRIERILITHYHPDHFGLAGWMQEQSGAPVWIGQRSLELARTFWGPGMPISGRILDLYRAHGMDEATLAEMAGHLASFAGQVHPFPTEAVIIEPGGTLELGGMSWDIRLAEGHASGQLIFYQPDTQVLFCGDQVLERISPNVSLQPGDDPDPLRTFLTSLGELGQWPVRIAYPGHREPISAFAARTEELLRHHRERLDAFKELLRQPNHAFGLCRQFFGTGLSIHQLRFAMAETLAHLVYLRGQGECAELERNGTRMFSLEA